MSIVVRCKCGKKFKAKAQLAGRKVRCPGCREPLRIPQCGPSLVSSNDPTKRITKKAPSKSVPADSEAAILKFEEIQQKKAVDAESQATYRQEQNKLIESYDQLTGRDTKKAKKKKKGSATDGKPKKRTFFTKLADAYGIIFGTLLAKYLIIAALAAGAVLGSVFLVQKITTYTAQETKPQKPKKQRIKDLYKEVAKAINSGKYSEANSKLEKIVQLDPAQENNRTYMHWRKKLEEAY